VEGIRVYRLPERPETFTGRLRFALDVLWFLARRHSEYDILHLHSVYRWFSYTAIIVAKLLRKPVIVKLTLSGSTDFSSIRRQSFGWAKVAILRLANQTVCLNEEILQQGLDSGFPSSQLLRIPNGVDDNRFHPVTEKEKLDIRCELGLPPDRLISIFVGGLTRRKGVDTLLDCWRRISHSYPKVQLILIGPINDQDNKFYDEVSFSVQQRINECETGTVINLGYVEKVEKYLQSADIFVFPSRAEGLPNVLLEAMACGLPSIASNISGIVDVASDRVEALLVEPDNVTQLVRAMECLLESRELREKLGIAARQRVELNFSLESVAQRYIAKYRELINDLSQ
jgi:glycosyltransferase involved in cell wall biosynthesis